jgi:tetratricopeptide (TPR) repeat protein
MFMIVCTKRLNAACAPRRPSSLRSAVLPFPARPGLPFSFLLALLCLALPLSGRRATPASRWLFLKAQDAFYNLELDDAARHYRDLLAADPENPDYWTGLAHVHLFQQLQRIGKFEGEVYPAATAIAPVPSASGPQLVSSMWEALARARSICEKRVAANPRDLDAHFFLGLSYAIESSYHVNVARRYFDALGPATRARDAHQRVLQLDPGHHDANLVIGTYEYGIGSIPLAFRWIVKMVGHSGTKEHGLELIRDALVHGSRGPGAPLLMLAYIHNREKQFAYSRQMLEQLNRFYPRNPYYELQIASSFRKEGDLDAAAQVYRRVEKKAEQHLPGFNAVDLPRLRFQIATVLESLRQRDLALNYYQRILPWENNPNTAVHTPGPLQAHAYLRMANLRRELGHRDAAREFYQKALEFPEPEVQKLARKALKKLNE